MTSTALVHAPASPRRLAFGGRPAAGLGVLALAAAIGLPLALQLGTPALVAGAAALVAAVAYTAGPFPLAYHGLGEAFVFAFFGPVAVIGTAWVQQSRLALAASLPVGLLATAILLVNNVRDLDGDRRARKRTLAVRLGRPAARALYGAALALAFAAPAGLAAGLGTLALLLAQARGPLAPAPLRAVLRAVDLLDPERRAAATACLHLAFGLLRRGLCVDDPAARAGGGTPCRCARHWRPAADRSRREGRRLPPRGRRQRRPRRGLAAPPGANLAGGARPQARLRGAATRPSAPA
ncbi:MAG: prenyltransferase [bacterium]|nr:prenyltransferase [bacterium]